MGRLPDEPLRVDWPLLRGYHLSVGPLPEARLLRNPVEGMR